MVKGNWNRQESQQGTQCLTLLVMVVVACKGDGDASHDVIDLVISIFLIFSLLTNNSDANGTVKSERARTLGQRRASNAELVRMFYKTLPKSPQRWYHSQFDTESGIHCVWIEKWGKSIKNEFSVGTTLQEVQMQERRKDIYYFWRSNWWMISGSLVRNFQIIRGLPLAWVP